MLDIFETLLDFFRGQDTARSMLGDFQLAMRILNRLEAHNTRFNMHGSSPAPTIQVGDGILSLSFCALYINRFSCESPHHCHRFPLEHSGILMTNVTAALSSCSQDTVRLVSMILTRSSKFSAAERRNCTVGADVLTLLLRFLQDPRLVKEARPPPRPGRPQQLLGDTTSLSPLSKWVELCMVQFSTVLLQRFVV